MTVPTQVPFERAGSFWNRARARLMGVKVEAVEKDHVLLRFPVWLPVHVRRDVVRRIKADARIKYPDRDFTTYMGDRLVRFEWSFKDEPMPVRPDPGETST